MYHKYFQRVLAPGLLWNSCMCTMHVLYECEKPRVICGHGRTHTCRTQVVLFNEICFDKVKRNAFCYFAKQKVSVSLFLLFRKTKIKRFVKIPTKGCLITSPQPSRLELHKNFCLPTPKGWSRAYIWSYFLYGWSWSMVSSLKYFFPSATKYREEGVNMTGIFRGYYQAGWDYHIFPTMIPGSSKSTYVAIFFYQGAGICEHSGRRAVLRHYRRKQAATEQHQGSQNPSVNYCCIPVIRFFDEYEKK